MTALKNKNQLLQRIQRILNEPQSNNATLKGLFAAIILVICFFATSLDAQEKPMIPATFEAQKIEIPTAPKTNFPKVEISLNDSEKVFPEIPEATPKPPVPVLPVAPMPPIPPVKGLQPIQPPQPIQSIGLKSFSFIPESEDLVINKNFNELDEVVFLKDTIIDEEVKEIIIIKSVKEDNKPTKDVKISIKKNGKKEEISVYENGRKLSKKEAKKYKAEARTIEAASEIKHLERKIKKEERRILAEERKILAEERKIMAKEQKYLLKERLEIKKDMEESHTEMLREVQIMEEERAAEIERFKAEQQKMHLEMERLDKEKSKEIKGKKKEKSKNESGQTEDFRPAVKGWAEAVNDLEETIGFAAASSASITTTTTSTTTTDCAETTNDRWFDEYIAILKKDGLLESESKDIRLKLSENFMRLNGKKLSQIQAKKYYRLYEKMSGTKINGTVEIRKSSKSF